MSTILVVDDDADVRRALRRHLERPDCRVLEAASSQEAVAAIADQRPDLVVLDIRLGKENGLQVLRRLRELDPRLLVLMMTAYGTTQTAIEAMKLGAYDYVLKPFDLPKLRAVIDAALRTAHAMRAVVSYQPLLASEEYAEGIIGKSEPMQQVFKLIGQVALAEATVLITGESGTGKELVARAIYHHSQRAARSFLAVNCAAIPENLLESELFGHERGAFTGAGDRRIGKFEQCDHGTIFLDEIGDMSLPTQTKILRVLQNGEFQRVGGTPTITVDVRVLAATNQRLERLVSEGRFREDLYYRLDVLRIDLPPLRDRRDDIPLLVDYFLHRPGQDRRAGVGPVRIAPAALAILQESRWPGNVRELENAVARAAVVARGNCILADDLPPDLRSPPRTPATVEPGAAVAAAAQSLFDLARQDPALKIMAAVERELIVRALAETSGNQVQAAKLLGVTRATLRKRIQKFGIERRLDVR